MYQTEYLRKRTTVADEIARIRSGDTIYMGGASLMPVDFAKGLGQLAGRVRDVRVLHYQPLEDISAFRDPACQDTFQFQSVFYNGLLTGADALGRCSFIPNNLRNAARDWAFAVPEYDVMAVCVSPMDKHGYFSLAGASLLESDLLSHARRLVVEVASRAPRVFGDVMIHISQVDAILESDRYPAQLPRRTPDEVDRRLGKVVADLVEDGDTIQLGIGGTIDALAVELREKKHLGIHTEMFSDSAMELMQCGAVDNSRKTSERGRTVTSFSMGTKALYDFIDDNPAIVHKALSYTNDPNVIAANRGMASINAALQVDLTGQCASESLGTRQISGSGGQVDTAVGAQMSPGGKSVIIVHSTYESRDKHTGEKHLQSRILPVLPQGTPVTLTRANTHFVATEYGAVCLRGLTLPQRAKALISIAHPDFRAWLEEEFERWYHRRVKDGT